MCYSNATGVLHCLSTGDMAEVYEMNAGPFAIPPQPKHSKTPRSLEGALSWLESLRTTKDMGDAHKRLLRSSADDKYAKSLRAHDALKAFQSRLLASLSAWPRDEGQPANSLESIVSRLTVLIRETTAHSIEPQVRVVCP